MLDAIAIMHDFPFFYCYYLEYYEHVTPDVFALNFGIPCELTKNAISVGQLVLAPRKGLRSLT